MKTIMKKDNFKKLKKIAVLTTPSNWFVPHAEKLVKILKQKKFQAQLFFDHKEVTNEYQIVFIASYHKIIDKKYLKQHKYNLVVHGSNLPKGKGWAPIFWQVIEGKNKIPIVLFEATEAVDAGKIYLKDYIKLTGTELQKEIRKLQAQKTIELYLKFLGEFEKLKPKKQIGTSTFYPKRNSKNSELNINQSIKKQFNLLRTVNNKDFPAFFVIKNQKYIVKIYKEQLAFDTRKKK